ncbi:bifunctional metallophosphatase/5'-nucleotidase [Lederbergia sp. NSJ-179]|uniref:bifunctional metallophosphatase/5'-nucleotidase n=1 Tax=Lederbergia sp. NSJ-179 TaxID=2931402 RepID=UPI001FD44108|nr:bifunctional UDP-sugar hydrolase/5'-nucleotidase [Lederbergia sp. NSJ-179]MCJ7840312.1 bifunctional metallophosphatase/5'-nucleotidase [Lederbergia sp. NSJ-179]
MIERIHIYHTNDLHSHFEYWPRIQAFLQEKQRLHAAAGEEVYLFDCGDFSDRWHPFTEGTRGKGNTQLLNETGYTAVTIGNNEGITLSHENLDELYQEAQFEVIVANLYEADQMRPKWCVPYQIYETRMGTKIGVTAVTTYYQKLYELLEWKLTEPFTELEIQLNRIKEEADVLVVLSHLGIHDDEKMIQLFPQIDLILGSHTHHFFMEGKRVGKTMMAAGGKHGRFVGYVQLLVDPLAPHFQSMSAKLFTSKELPAVAHEHEQLQQLADIGKKQLDVTIATVDHTFDFSWKETSELPLLLCDAVHEWCEAECTMLNSGLILTSLEKGRVTKYHLHQMLPHPINPCTVELSGAELKEIILHAENEDWSEVEVIGLGFRGKVMGKFVYRGIEVDQEKLQVHINGSPLDPDRMYKLGTVDLFTFGNFFPEIKRSPNKAYFMPEFLRDVMEWKLQNI